MIKWPESGGTIKEFCKSGIPDQSGKVACLFLRKIQILRVNNSRILTIKNRKFLGYYFYMNLNIWGDF